MNMRHLILASTAVVAICSFADIFAVSPASKYLKRPNEWFASREALDIAANILSYQADLGGWPKNVDTTAGPYTGECKNLKPTFDNDATTDELRFLARVFNATKDAKYAKAAVTGIDYILSAQYPSGGWPQFAPPPKSYHRHITFNDNAMIHVMELLRETYSSDSFAFLDAGRKQSARQAFDRDVQCILKCQIKVDGKLTAWCAQHDAQDFSPQPGRSYELISISGNESVGIVRLLMSLEKPSPEVIAAVDGAVAWFDKAKIPGIRVEVQDDVKSPTGKNRAVVNDPAATPMWARFYEIGTNQPIFCDRDGVPKRNLSDIGYERRNGYTWLGNWPRRLLENEYPEWKSKVR